LQTLELGFAALFFGETTGELTAMKSSNNFNFFGLLTLREIHETWVVGTMMMIPKQLSKQMYHHRDTNSNRGALGVVASTFAP
jgi:hypothetical protein